MASLPSQGKENLSDPSNSYLPLPLDRPLEVTLWKLPRGTEHCCGLFQEPQGLGPADKTLSLGLRVACVHRGDGHQALPCWLLQASLAALSSTPWACLPSPIPGSQSVSLVSGPRIALMGQDPAQDSWSGGQI